MSLAIFVFKLFKLANIFLGTWMIYKEHYIYSVIPIATSLFLLFVECCADN